MNEYVFDKMDAQRFANFQGIKTKTKYDELHFERCPYCGQNTNDKNTFSINLRTGQFKCLRASCGAHGNMLTLAKDFGFTLSNYQEQTADHEWTVWRKFPKPKPADPALEYLAKRGIGAETAKRYHITARGSNPNTLVFPFYDYDDPDQLVMMKYRNMKFVKGETDGPKEWGEKNCKPILFGMDTCDPEQSKTLWLTEGQIDTLSLSEVGIKNVVSVPTGALGFTWVPHCWKFLKMFDKLVVFGDFENGKVSLLEEMTKRFEGRVYRVPDAYYFGEKDANDILTKHGAQKLLEATEHIEEMVNPVITPIESIKHVDVNDLKRCQTSIGALDDIIGGFYFGQLIVITGKRGEGKSTLAGQIGANFMGDGYPALFYSGELSDWYFKMWLDRQVAGPNNVKKDNYDYYVPKAAMEKVNNFYKMHGAYLVNNRTIGTDEFPGIIESFEQSIKRYGVKAIVVDNLMTAMDDNISSDFYRQQSNFVKQLSQLAKEYMVCIFLVSHPKKTNSADLENDDVSGSSNITNLADVVLSYSMPARDKDGHVDDSIRELRVLKNRLTGKLTKYPIRLSFDEPSKRIYGEGKPCDWDLLEIKDKDGFVFGEFAGENPFE